MKKPLLEAGDLVWILSSSQDGVYLPPALILRSYQGYPKVFPHNEKENQSWIEAMKIEESIVYDIIHMGNIEKGVHEEWLLPVDEDIHSRTIKLS